MPRRPVRRPVQHRLRGRQHVAAGAAARAGARRDRRGRLAGRPRCCWCSRTSRWPGSRVDVPDNRHARRVRTQVVMLRRVTIAVIVVLAVGVMLMTFPAVRALGASVLASRRRGRRGRRAGRAEHARQRLRRPPARLQRRGPARRRGGRRGGVGPDRGDDPQLRGGADLGRPAADPAHLVLHHQAVPELDPDRGRRCSAPPSSTSTGRSRCSRCARSCAGCARAPTCGTAGSACCR